ncbi:thiamine pyrophosphate-dependent enzyme [Sporomusa termitida]|uniref:2-oxoacid:acceptor oxidoreductase, beta subunit, pyruvate/2-ketoisovalerate family n=1 Tax=Sporomusa termitida TaxID=2377 RepID=A0A517DW17_9FIRM|nr:thiamine pyrophosphate-dependent enzyme [Sporomusa termitida]QDR81541.1 2-oxoacid:acceptor oxidoreductase, beta subunit, pyruvate/2-ketoisovalerate family [Sporomusa termitida]
MSSRDYIKEDQFPLFTCPGCTHGTVINAFVRAADELQLDRGKTVIVCAIGCAGRTPTYLDFNVLRVTHGRALAFATGIKLARPDVKVIVFMGDGDALAIGGNHFIHAARRNIDITSVVFRNEIYGMTGGQYSPTTPVGHKATTAPYGMIEPSFDTCELAASAGATYVARGDVYNVGNLYKVMKAALQHKGFAVVEALTSCPIQFGRRNKLADPAKMVERIKNMVVTKTAAEKLPPAELAEKFVIGEFVNTRKLELTERYAKLLDRRKKDTEVVITMG